MRLIKLSLDFNRTSLLVSLALIVFSASLLYIPFLGNGLVFDDNNLYKNLSVYQFAITPFNLQPRTFPYFTLGFVQVLYDSFVVSRVVSLVLHISCSFFLFLLIRRLLSASVVYKSQYSGDIGSRLYGTTVTALLVAIWFAINPIAVYGAAYLVQRTILFATLFSLLCLIYFCRGIERNSWPDIAIAAFYYSLAVFSKEHAIMVFAAALPISVIYQKQGPFCIKKIVAFFFLCLPAGLIVFAHSGHVVGNSYEPDVNVLLPSIHSFNLLGNQLGQWLLSSLAQMNFFFDYLQYWYVPDVRILSIDIRIEFDRLWLSWWFFLKVFLFLISPLICLLILLKRSGVVVLFAVGFLYCWVVFFTELVSVRFQEPFVLYRSYIWAPGYAMMLASIFYVFCVTRWRIIGVVLVFICLGLMARDRLLSLASDGAVWKDAAAKLQSDTVSGSGRIFYNRGRQYLREENLEGAISDFSVAIAQNPHAYYAYYHRGTAYSALSKFEEAEVDFDIALSINNKYGPIYYAKGLLYERKGCPDDATNAYSNALKLGVAIAQLRLDELAKKTLLDQNEIGIDHICHLAAT